MSEEQKARVQAQFGPSAAAYVASAGHAAGPDLEQLLAWGRKRAAARVLDIATGGGHTALAFSRFTPSVVAIDLTPPMLQAARDFAVAEHVASLRFLAADVEALPFRDATFGTVTCRIAAHHFPALLPALRQVARVLRPGARFWSRTSWATTTKRPPRSFWKWSGGGIRATCAPSASWSGPRSCARPA